MGLSLHAACVAKFKSDTVFAWLVALIMVASWLVTPAHAQTIESVDDIFAPENRNALVMQIEAAIATAQSEVGLVSQAAAAEITQKADPKYAPLEDIAEEYKKVRHRMVAFLNVWRRSLSEEAANALHRGVTTVDIYDTVLVLQLIGSIDVMQQDMRKLEQDLICLSTQYADTPMMGRTLGQHALPITFGKKSVVWAAQNRRNINRLNEVRARLASSGVLKGAVGTHLGLGPDAVTIEASVSRVLGLSAPEPADWRPARDVFAEYAQTLALISKSNAALGGEIFRLQMTDIGEVYERRISTAVGSSTMPHKRNPSLSESLVYAGRVIPALSQVVLKDVESVFERDNTSRPNRALEEITRETSTQIKNARKLIRRLEVNPARMRENMNRTDGMIMAQRIVLFLEPHIGLEAAEHKVRDAAQRSLDDGLPFAQSLLADQTLRPWLEDELDTLLNPETYTGLSGQQVTRTANWITRQRQESDEPQLRTCPTK